MKFLLVSSGLFSKTLQGFKDGEIVALALCSIWHKCFKNVEQHCQYVDPMFKQFRCVETNLLEQHFQ